MEITTKEMKTTTNLVINLIAAIYFTNHQKRFDFLKKHPCIIYVKNAVNVNFKNLQPDKTKSISALTLKFSKYDAR